MSKKKPKKIRVTNPVEALESGLQVAKSELDDDFNPATTTEEPTEEEVEEAVSAAPIPRHYAPKLSQEQNDRLLALFKAFRKNQLSAIQGRELDKMREWAETAAAKKDGVVVYTAKSAKTAAAEGKLLLEYCGMKEDVSTVHQAILSILAEQGIEYDVLEIGQISLNIAA